MLVNFQVTKNRQPFFSMSIDSLCEVNEDDVANIRQYLIKKPLPIGCYAYDTATKEIHEPDTTPEIRQREADASASKIRHWWVS